jgi:hypothetical protein
MRVVAAALIPGLAYQLTGPRWVAKAIWIAFGILGLVFLAGLGTFLAEAAFGLMICTHVVSASHLMRPLMRQNRLALQLVFGVILFMAFSLWVYIPVRGWFQNHVAMPLRIQEQVIVINPRIDTTAVRRGDRVAYRIPGSRRRGIIVQEGLGLRPVWGMPGDQVVFGDGILRVNGMERMVSASRRDWGQRTVPEECWFIWPDFDMVNRGVAESGLADRLRDLAFVEQGHLVGRPYGWWFFRAQGSL